MEKRVTSIILILVVVQLINPFVSFAQSISDNYNHHNHNFGTFYDNPKTQVETYAAQHRNALQMGYSMVSRGKPDDQKYSDLGILKNHNAMVAPVRFHDLNTDTPKFHYYDRYHLAYDANEGRYISAFDATRHVGKKYDIDSGIVTFIKQYGCAKKDNYDDLTVQNFSYQTLEDLFHTSWRLKDDSEVVKSAGLFSNWQSDYVVQDLADKTVNSLDHLVDKVDGIFFDQITGYQGECKNANAFGGTIHNGGLGQKIFLKTVYDQVKSKQNRKGVPYFVTVNIGHPITKSTRPARWYTDPDPNSRLRFDYYYSETGIIRDEANGEILHSLAANGTDPETGKPAFINDDGNYLPADRVAVDAEAFWYGLTNVDLAHYHYREDDYWDANNCSPPTSIIYDDYFTQHLRAAGIAGNQGSWFGYYGEDNILDKDKYTCVDGTPVRKTDDKEKELVFTGDLQLLRAMPNWDNLLDIPLNQRQWDEPSLIYQSNTSDGNIQSYASKDIVYSHHFETRELFASFITPQGEIVLNPGETIQSAYFTNEYFEKTIEDARGCLNINTVENTITLKLECSNKFKTGIRISSTIPPFTNGLVSHWTFDEDSGDTIDSVSGHNGTLVNVEGTGREEGIHGNALLLDGVDDFVFIGDVLDMHTSDMSISFWVKTNTTSYSSAISKAFNVPYYNLVILGSGKPAVSIHNGEAVIQAISPSTVNDGEWHHLVGVWDRNNSMQVYIDGDIKKSLDISTDAELTISNPNGFTFGTNCSYPATIVDPDEDGNRKCKDGYTNQLQGSLDEIKIFNKALTAEEVEDLYDEFEVDGDADGDGDVDITDYSIWLSEHGGNPPDPIYDPDFNNDGNVDGQDFIIWVNNYGT